jgi:LmbE family N-acetylglucosaminyl deacetylase
MPPRGAVGHDGAVSYTVVSFHAHPDDEALLTAGTLARAAAEGHRVVLVSATDGEAGLAASDRDPLTDAATQGLGPRRVQELRRAAAAIGCHDVRLLGYDDSGLDGRAGREGRRFATADPEEAAGRLAAILVDTGADVLTVYDAAGGYGHPDHVQIHRVGTRAADMAGTAVVLEATVDRRPLVRVLRLLQGLGILRRAGVDSREWSPARFDRAFADPGSITHRVNTRRYAGAKRAAMAAHASQATADEGVRTLAVFLRLPAFVFACVFAHEWFVERGRPVPPAPLDDIFASLRAASKAASSRPLGAA